MQLRDLSIENRFKALNIKSIMTDDERVSLLFLEDYYSVVNGINALIATEPAFFLINDDFLEAGLLVSEFHNNHFAIKELEELYDLDNKDKEQMMNDFYDKECLVRKIVFNYDDYMELLELDDLLLKGYDYNDLIDNPYILNRYNHILLIDNPYILFSISYLKTLFSDYYATNRKADNYLYNILLELSKDKTLSNMDLIAINETMELFTERGNAKIITFPKK